MKIRLCQWELTRRFIGGAVALLATFSLSMWDSPLSAQTWSAVGDGNWNVAGNWDSNAVPNSDTSDVIIDTGNDVTVFLNINALVRELAIGTGDTLNIEQARTLTVHGNVVNNGLLAVNPLGGGFGTQLIFNSNSDLSGNGSIRFGREGVLASLSTTVGNTLTQQAGHTIEGVGNIAGSLVNNGVVRADASLGTGSELTLLTNDKTNTNLFEAVTNSTLNINGISVNNSGGTIRANGADSVVQLSGGMSVSGGTLESFDGGVFWTSSAGAKTLSNVVSNATINVASATTLSAEGTLTNNGLISVNPTAGGFGTVFNASNDLALNGSGAIRLGREGGSLAQITTNADKTITQQAGHTIEGVGSIAGSLVNNGVVRADASLGSGSELTLLTNDKTNNGLFSAVNGGILRVDSGVLTNWDAGSQTLTGGTYEVIGDSTMRLVGVDVQTLNAHVRLDGADSKFYSAATGTPNALASLDTIGASGQLTLRDGRQLTTAAGLMSQGIISLDGATTQLTVSDNFMQTGGTLILNSGGTLAASTGEANGGLIAGNGTITGDFMFGGTAVISPGASPGELKFDDNLTWDAGGSILFDLGLDGVDSDLISVGGDLLKSGVGSYAFTFTDNGWVVGQTYDLIKFNSTDFLLSDFSFTNSGGFVGSFGYASGNTLQFTLNAVPEPNSCLLVSMAMVVVSMRRRRTA